MTRQTSSSDNVKVLEWNIDAFRERLKRAMDGRTPYSMEQETGIAQSLIRKYLSGSSTPGADKLVALSLATGASVGWLATGHGCGRAECGQEEAAASPPSLEAGQLGVGAEKPAVDGRLLEKALERVKEAEERLEVKLDPRNAARVVQMIYQWLALSEAGVTRVMVDDVVRLAARF